MTLEEKTGELIAWCEENAADDRDLREALSAAGILLGQRADAAYRAELATVKAFVDSERVKGGKPPIVPDAAALEASIAPAS